MTSAAPPASSTATEDLSKKKVTIRLRIIAGRDLKNVDLVGSSDPYVQFKDADGNSYKTEVINNNLDPVWNQTFEVKVKLVKKLKLKVFDEGTVRDKSLGMLKLDLRTLDLTKGQELKRIFSLEKVDKGRLEVGITPIDYP